LSVYVFQKYKKTCTIYIHSEKKSGNSICVIGKIRG
jgi:hypothetical protein